MGALESVRGLSPESSGGASESELSLLTSDAYALLFAALVDRRLPPPLYFVALIVIGMFIVMNLFLAILLNVFTCTFVARDPRATVG